MRRADAERVLRSWDTLNDFLRGCYSVTTLTQLRSAELRREPAHRESFVRRIESRLAMIGGRL